MFEYAEQLIFQYQFSKFSVICYQIPCCMLRMLLQKCLNIAQLLLQFRLISLCSKSQKLELNSYWLLICVELTFINYFDLINLLCSTDLHKIYFSIFRVNLNCFYMLVLALYAICKIYRHKQNHYLTTMGTILLCCLNLLNQLQQYYLIINRMGLHSVIAVLLPIIIAGQIVVTDRFPTFDQYLKQFNKQYPSLQEYLQRRTIYNKNVWKLERISTQLQYQVGVNRFTDRSEQQISQMKNGRIKPPLRSVTPHMSINRKLGGPSSLDWRQKGKVSSIKDQGYCGSCWAFATAAYCQSSLMINSGYNNQIDLSQQYLLQCTQQSDCKGGFPAYALLTVLNHGIPKQQFFPYNPAATHPDICSTRKSIKVKGKQVYLYSRLSDLEMIYLLQTSPVIVGVSSLNWQIYTGGIMKCVINSNITEDHAVLLVGYTKQYWIIKNQWGPDWGQNGFMRITRHPDYNCLMGVEVDLMYEQFTSRGVLLLTLMILFLNYD